MDIKTIKQRLADAHGITALNDMQMQMAADAASRLILLAPTGSGKTVAFTIRLLRELTPRQGASRP